MTAQPCRTTAAMPLRAQNTYYLMKDDCIEVDPFKDYDYGWGFDYYIDVFRQLEKRRVFSGLKVFIAYTTPARLPVSDGRSILVILADEQYEYVPYVKDLLCIFRCIGSQPVYLDGWPKSALHLSALLHFFYKTLSRGRSIVRAFRKSARVHLSEARAKTTHVPLGLFWRFNSDPRPISERSIDYAFLGSVAFEPRQRKWIHRLLNSPKILSRREMIDALGQADTRFQGKVYTTGDFEESIANRKVYIETLLNTKISIVPRGTSYETLRFFESIKAGCVVVCEKMPREWCYDNHPGIVIEKWSDLPDLLSKLLSDPALLEQKAAAAKTYWENRCSEQAVGAYISRIILEALGACETRARLAPARLGGRSRW